MGNEFFNDHSMLGALFDFDRDGSLDIGEAMFMGAMGAAIIDEEERSSEKAKRKSSTWDDDDYWESDSEGTIW